jgi:glucose/arabinose dehydrogenase
VLFIPEGISMNPSFAYRDFSNTGDLWFNGEARQFANSLQLTTDNVNQSGSSFYKTAIQVDGSTSFSTQFQFRLGGGLGTYGSDGFTFMLHNVDTAAATLGVYGGSVGYGGIDRSLAIKFDTFLNEGIDINDNSVGVYTNGNIFTPLAVQAAPFDLNGGDVLTAWIDYNGQTDQLNVYLSNDNVKPGAALVATTVDLAGLVGRQAYFGFSGATGDVQAVEEILGWGFSSDNARLGAAPAPVATLALDNPLGSDRLVFNGSAQSLSGDLQLTNGSGISQRASVFYDQALKVDNGTGFNTQFQFRLDQGAGTDGSDGFTFLLQNDGTAVTALGNIGGSVGYGGINNSIAIKFDSYKNGALDPSSNSVALLRNGQTTSATAKAVNFDLNSGDLYTAWVEYDGLTNQMNVYLSNGTTKPATTVLTETIDLAAVVGNQAYVGFTGATGTLAQRQTLSNWQFVSNERTGGNGDGLRGEYYDNADFTNLKLVRTDATVNFDWKVAAPVPALAPDTFSVRWSGQVEAVYSEAYQFYTNSDDGVRLYVNGQLVIDQFIDQGVTEYSTAPLTLEAGNKYDIVLEYFDSTGDASAQLSWSSATQAKQIIPRAYLYANSRPEVVLATNGLTIAENGGSAIIELRRNGDTSGTGTFEIVVTPVTAVLGTDFTVPNLPRVTFAPGEVVKTLEIPILNDGISEPTKTFSVGIQVIDGNIPLGISRTGLITIIDDDAPASFTFKQTNYPVGENGGAVTVTVERTGNTAGTSTVTYTTTNGTATAGADYTAVTGTLTFAPGEIAKNFQVTILDDQISEVNETVNLTLSNPVGGVFTPNNSIVNATVTIADNDVANSFVREKAYNGGLDKPTIIEFTPTGDYMFVGEKPGIVKVAKRNAAGLYDQQGQDFIDISDMVNAADNDRGLIGLALNPNFGFGPGKDPYIYLSYTFDPPGLAKDNNNNRPARLSRFTAQLVNGVVTAIAGSEKILLGKNSLAQYTQDIDSTPNTPETQNRQPSGIATGTWDFDNNVLNGTWVQDYISGDSQSHSIGEVQFGPDGNLYVTIGDGTSYNYADKRAPRVQDVNNLSGKMLRINPETGEGIADNPFVQGGNLTSNRSKVYQLGFRNPFRFTFTPDSTADNVKTIVGDVGWFTAEEINTGGKGGNFGWPYYEGNNVTTAYSAFGGAQPFYNSLAGQTAFKPVYSYRVPNTGNAVVAGDFYQAGGDFKDTFFIGDASRGTVDALSFNEVGDPGSGVKTIKSVATNLFGVVNLITAPDGSVYYVQIAGPTGGQIGRFRPVVA